MIEPSDLPVAEATVKSTFRVHNIWEMLALYRTKCNGDVQVKPTGKLEK